MQYKGRAGLGKKLTLINFVRVGLTHKKGVASRQIIIIIIKSNKKNHLNQAK